jgi:hypothetical protein
MFLELEHAAQKKIKSAYLKLPAFLVKRVAARIGGLW